MQAADRGACDLLECPRWALILPLKLRGVVYASPGIGEAADLFENLHATIGASPAYPTGPPSLSLLVTMPMIKGTAKTLEPSRTMRVIMLGATYCAELRRCCEKR
jgi:hypothetical protein